jgi:ribosomal protein S14
MKKLIERDKKLRREIKKTEKQHFILKSISKNLKMFTLIRWKAFVKLETLTKKASRVALSSRCIQSSNKKRYSKLTKFSRHIFLKLIRSGNVSGIQKSSW